MSFYQPLIMAIIITMSNKSTRCTVQAASVQRLLRFENSQRQLEKNSKLETASMQPRSEQRQLISRDSFFLFVPDDVEVSQGLRRFTVLGCATRARRLERPKRLVLLELSAAIQLTAKRRAKSRFTKFSSRFPCNILR